MSQTAPQPRVAIKPIHLAELAIDAHIAIKFKSPAKRYGETAVADDLTLNIHVEAIYGLLGPCGAGKSITIAKLVGGMASTSIRE